MKTLTGTNAVDYVLANKNRVLLHICNTQGVMGSGIALEIKNRIPSAYAAYKDCESVVGLYLGGISCSGKVANLHAQRNYGRGTRHLNYGALVSCFRSFIERYDYHYGEEVVIPHLMGCDRAGGDWEIVMELIEFILCDFNVTICAIGEMK